MIAKGTITIIKKITSKDSAIYKRQCEPTAL